jgi:hypothetical protein
MRGNKVSQVVLGVRWVEGRKSGVEFWTVITGKKDLIVSGFMEN